LIEFLTLKKILDGYNAENIQVIRVSIIDGRSRKPRYLPLGVPSIYANEIKEFHDNPFVFWASQILNYIMRFKPEFEAILNENSKRLGLRTPCVGLDIC
jgi:hypothetical protein